MASAHSSSLSKTRALPLVFIISSATADRFTTLPFSAKLPESTIIPPTGEYGLFVGRITSGFLFTADLIESPSFPLTVCSSR
jgi:hypothetical protein